MLRRCFLQSLGAAPTAIGQQRPAAPPPEPFRPAEGANRPAGTGQGIHPGRVVWVRDAAATRWDGVTGHWWDDAHTDERVVHSMTDRLLGGLTGRKNGRKCWE